MSEKKGIKPSIYAIKTMVGQEKNAAELVASRIKTNSFPIISILAPETLRGYIFIEAQGPHIVEEAIKGIKHIRSRIPGKVPFSEIEKYLITKPIIEELDVGYTVEITGGPFRGMKAKITRVNKVRQEATLELLEATFTLPITVSSDYLKLVSKTVVPKQEVES
ncbi:MAG: transcription elongation factor Spt5 [Candidatus Bathyarchaeota archaeon]|nr:MAG: transcription elongation factor Spt5 [Candidatus Bathyarchaeota archaeon]